jgi:hypothetical protein
MEVGLVQVNTEPTWSAAGVGDNVVRYAMLPYSVGLLQAYAQRHAENAEQLRFRPAVFSRIALRDAVDSLDGCDVVGFSLYVWNEQISLAIARELKRRRRATKIVFGGPQVPDLAEEWLRANECVDIACHGAGEMTFTRILEGVPWEEIPGISFLHGGAFHDVPLMPRLTDYSDLPSPYLDGTFGPLMALHSDRSWVMMWETNRGCPFSCTFCDWGSATNAKVIRFDLDRIQAEIDWMGRNQIGMVHCADANFGILKRDVQIAEAIVASTRATGYPFAFYVNSTKNATDRVYTIQRLLTDAMSTMGVTIALQSNDPGTLEAIKRKNISTVHYEELQRRFSHDQLYTYTDLIIGLAGESYDTFADGVSHVAAHGQHNNVQFRNCYLLPNAEMAAPAYREKYGLKVVSQELREAHLLVGEVDEIPEFMDIVISTNTMDRESWVRAKMFAWLSDALYFDRLMQLPMLLLGSEAGIPLRRLIELFAAADPATAPVIARLVAQLRDKAVAIQNGGLEWFDGTDAGGILWPADQWTMITLVREGLLQDFYAEASTLLLGLLDDTGLVHHHQIVSDAVELNRVLFSTPEEAEGAEVFVWHNIWERYLAVLHHEDLPLTQRFTRYTVGSSPYTATTLDDWYAQLVWCDWRDKRAYLRPLRPNVPRRRAAAKVAA